ncbi:hypothetical protein AAGL78_22885, partial [Klebsiella pneumoniae]
MSEMTDLLNLSKTPAFRIVIAGKDATQTLDKRLLSMTLTDNLLWSSFFGHADQMVGLCTGGQLGGRA